VSGLFAMLLMGHFWIAVGFLAAGALAVLGWHHRGVAAA
jgi:hypothetical protein